MKIHHHHTKDGIYHEARFNGVSLYAFKMNELVDQLFKIYGIDYRRFLFGEKNGRKLTKQEKFN